MSLQESTAPAPMPLDEITSQAPMSLQESTPHVPIPPQESTSCVVMSPQEHTLPLLQGTTTLESALKNEEDMLANLSYPEQRLEFFIFLLDHREEIEDIVTYHLSLTKSETCRLGEVQEWLCGSFNVCIPIYVDNWKKHPGRRVIIRFPLPYQNGGSAYPGSADEKLRCEAATFVWMQEHCPDVPIPKLWGFGFVGGQTVSCTATFAYDLDNN